MQSNIPIKGFFIVLFQNKTKSYYQLSVFCLNKSSLKRVNNPEQDIVSYIIPKLHKTVKEGISDNVKQNIQIHH